MADAETYFPRVKTGPVRRKLRRMMKIMYDDLGWELPVLSPGEDEEEENPIK